MVHDFRAFAHVEVAGTKQAVLTQLHRRHAHRREAERHRALLDGLQRTEVGAAQCGLGKGRALAQSIREADVRVTNCRRRERGRNGERRSSGTFEERCQLRMSGQAIECDPRDGFGQLRANDYATLLIDLQCAVQMRSQGCGPGKVGRHIGRLDLVIHHPINDCFRILLIEQPPARERLPE